MRIIAGKNRGLRLVTPRGMKTRPTTDRIKETLFNMIGPDIRDCRFLDLFAGSGQIGLEAVSRGAQIAVFVDRDRAAADCIRENIEKCHASDNCILLKQDVFAAIDTSVSYGPFDYIFIDPPYKGGLERKLCQTISESVDLLAEDGCMILEASLDLETDFLEKYGYTCVKQKKYKTNQHLFISNREGSRL